LQDYLTERRKQIDRTHGYRRSQLTLVFGKPLCEARLGEEELRGRYAEVQKDLGLRIFLVLRPRHVL